jgi:hypothetical protein
MNTIFWRLNVFVISQRHKVPGSRLKTTSFCWSRYLMTNKRVPQQNKQGIAPGGGGDMLVHKMQNSAHHQKHLT